MLANILYILCAIVPPCAAFVAHSAIEAKKHARSNDCLLTHVRIGFEHDKQKGMNAEQTAALLKNHDELQKLELRVKQLEMLCEEQQISLNRLADRNY